MVIKYSEILTVITTLCDDENLQVTFKESAKGGLIAGVTTILGGVLGGPRGLAAGGALGGVLAMINSKEFKPASRVIMYEMKPVDQDKLIRSINGIVADVDVGDAVELLAMIRGDPVLKARIIAEMTTFFKHAIDKQLV